MRDYELVAIGFLVGVVSVLMVSALARDPAPANWREAIRPQCASGRRYPRLGRRDPERDPSHRAQRAAAAKCAMICSCFSGGRYPPGRKERRQTGNRSDATASRSVRPDRTNRPTPWAEPSKGNSTRGWLQSRTAIARTAVSDNSSMAIRQRHPIGCPARCDIAIGPERTERFSRSLPSLLHVPQNVRCRGAASEAGRV